MLKGMEKHMELMGKPAKDIVTGFSGTVTSISFDLYGCVQGVITPKVKEGDLEIKCGHWFDVTRIKVTSDQPVMPLPDFEKGYISEGKKGAANKPEM